MHLPEGFSQALPMPFSQLRFYAAHYKVQQFGMRCNKQLSPQNVEMPFSTVQMQASVVKILQSQHQLFYYCNITF